MSTTIHGQKYCSGCGTIIHQSAQFCPHCGATQMASHAPPHHSHSPYGHPPVPYSSHGRTKVAAGILALLLGGIGVHKFYLGRGGQGVLYLLFCWTFIPALVSLIEGIIYLTMSDYDFDAKYNRAY